MNAKSSRVRALLAYFDRVFDRKTIRGFVEPVKSIDDLPLAVQEALRPHLNPADPVELILLAPPQSVLVARSKLEAWWPELFLPWQITPDRTLVLTPTRLLMASIAHPLQHVRPLPDAPESEQPVITSIPRAEVLFFELGTVLLNSWLDLAWCSQGCLERTRIYFNSVGAFLFEDLCRRMRGQDPGRAASGVGQGDRHLLADLPYKFKSLIPRRLLLAEEPVLAAAFRPALWSKGPPFLRHLLAPRLVALRSDRYLILTQEDLSPDGTNYGLITQFCPLDNLRQASLQETPSGPALVLSLAHSGVTHELRQQFLLPARQALEALVSPLP